MSEPRESKLLPKEPCERCGDMYYHPKVMIEDALQHASEWEGTCKTIRTEVLECEKLRDEYKKELLLSQAREIKLRDTLKAYACPYCAEGSCRDCYGYRSCEALNTTPEPPLLGVLEKVRDALESAKVQDEWEYVSSACELLDRAMGKGNI